MVPTTHPQTATYGTDKQKQTGSVIPTKKKPVPMLAVPSMVTMPVGRVIGEIAVMILVGDAMKDESHEVTKVLTGEIAP